MNQDPADLAAMDRALALAAEAGGRVTFRSARW